MSDLFSRGNDRKEYAWLRLKEKRLGQAPGRERYDRELRSGRNSRTGERLNATAAGYRMGYRAALGEQAAIYNAKKR